LDIVFFRLGDSTESEFYVLMFLRACEEELFFFARPMKMERQSVLIIVT